MEDSYDALEFTPSHDCESSESRQTMIINKNKIVDVVADGKNRHEQHSNDEDSEFTKTKSKTQPVRHISALNYIEK